MTSQRGWGYPPSLLSHVIDPVMHSSFILKDERARSRAQSSNMASKQKYLVSTTLLSEGGKVGQMLDEVAANHQVGGLYLTSRERDIIVEVLNEARDWCDLPCRITEVCAFFITLEGMRDKVCCEEAFNICRFAFGIPLKQMMDMWKSYIHAHREGGEPHPIKQFLRYLTQQATIKEEQFILDNCFTLPFCREHKFCNTFHAKCSGPARMCCCNLEKCKAFTNFHVRKALREPDAKVIEEIVLIVD